VNGRRWVVRCEQRKGGGCGAGPTIWRGKWRAFKNGGWEGKFGGVWKIEVHIEALMELFFFIKPPNFGVEGHMESPTGVALAGSFMARVNRWSFNSLLGENRLTARPCPLHVIVCVARF
jgi:hypothetical protein